MRITGPDEINEILQALEGIHVRTTKERRAFVLGFGLIILLGPFMVLSGIVKGLSPLSADGVVAYIFCPLLSLLFLLLTYDAQNISYRFHNKTIQKSSPLGSYTFFSLLDIYNWSLMYEEIVEIDIPYGEYEVTQLRLIPIIGRKKTLVCIDSMRTALAPLKSYKASS